ncbi:MAG: class I SAM-dependent methyltransferase [Gemmataceae bacterium]
MTRPCRCDRFQYGRLYVVDRDCPKCWLFAHRPSVRKAWGGDPADCDALFAARREMSTEQMADLLAGPPAVMPDGWRHWPVTRAAHLRLVERFLAALPPYPEGRFAGRGAVLCGGGPYEAGIYVACKMLRHVGWEYPIQVWHRGAAEPVSARVRRLPGVEVVDTEAHPARAARRLMGGWESKTLAILNSPFEEVLYLDADCYPVYNPAECFAPANNPHGVVVWPDMPIADDAVHWPTYGLRPDGQPGLNGGHYVLSKRRAWPVWQLASHYDNHSDYYYWRTVFDVTVGGFSDQEQVRAALHRLDVPYHRYAARPLACVHASYLQPGPGGRLLFVHRFDNKFDLSGRFRAPLQWHPGGLPMEVTAWRYFLEWATAAVDDPAFPEEVPGFFTRAECALWHRVCRDREVLELGRHHGRSTVVAAAVARRVVSLDRASAGPADRWLQCYGVRHRVWLREGEFAALVPTSGGPFSACLIDGDHDRASVAADLAAIVAHLTVDAVLGFHDYDDPHHPDVKPTVDAAAARYGWRLVERADHLAVFATGNGTAPSQRANGAVAG